MDCNCKPCNMCPPRPQIPTPPAMNTNCGCGTIPAPQMPIQPRQRFSGSCENPDRYPIAMAYVPWQTWKQTYPLDRSLQRGTIFPELDLPFVMGRCR